MYKVRIDDYLDLLEEFVFQGLHIQRIKDSLFRIGLKQVVMTATAPRSEDYFFGINYGYFRQADEVVLVCGNPHDLCAFRIPTVDLQGLNFSRSSNGKELVTTVGFDHQILDWYLTFNKVENQPTKMVIDKYHISLMSK